MAWRCAPEAGRLVENDFDRIASYFARGTGARPRLAARNVRREGTRARHRARRVRGRNRTPSRRRIPTLMPRCMPRWRAPRRGCASPGQASAASLPSLKRQLACGHLSIRSSPWLILFILNDPEAKNRRPHARSRRRPHAGPGKTAFDFGTLPQLKVWPADSPEFLVWQCREAVMRALAPCGEKIAGPAQALAGEHATEEELKVNIDEGSDLNAYYDRRVARVLSFQEQEDQAAAAIRRKHRCRLARVRTRAARCVRSPSSGTSNFPEPNAFHECSATASRC